MTAHLGISVDRIALNPIQWMYVAADPHDPDSEAVWRFDDPTFQDDYPSVLRQVRDCGFDAVMLALLPSMTLQRYKTMLDDAGLAPAPGYATIGLPEEHGVSLAGGAARMRWFDGVRRKAEESNFFGLSTVFLAPEMSWAPGSVRTLTATAVGADYRPDRMRRVIDLLGEAAEVLRAEGVRAGLHNHVGTWVETEAELDEVLGALPSDLLGASFDLGHLAWVGADPVAVVARYRDRVLDLHVKDLDLAVARWSRSTPTPYETAVGRGLFREPGTADIDVTAALRQLPDGWPGWVIVEVDQTVLAPRASAEACWRWVTQVFDQGSPQ